MLDCVCLAPRREGKVKVEDLGWRWMATGAEVGEGQGSPWEEETVPPISLATVPRISSNPPPSSKNIHKVSPLAAGEPGQGADPNYSASSSASELWPSSCPGATGARLRQQFPGLSGWGEKDCGVGTGLAEARWPLGPQACHRQSLDMQGR